MAEPIDTILFDLDGTLIDTEPSAAHAIQEGFRSWGVQVGREDSAYITGRTWASAFEYLFAKYSPSVPRVEAERLLLKIYRDELERSLITVPGGAQAVRDLAPSYRLALVSGSGRTEILWALDKLGIRALFRVILGAEDYPQGKPAPDGYLKALKLLGSDARRTLVFEDSEAGIASALAAGARVVAITTTNHFGHDTSRASGFIPDLRGVGPEWVRRFEAGAL